MKNVSCLAKRLSVCFLQCVLVTAYSHPGINADIKAFPTGLYNKQNHQEPEPNIRRDHTMAFVDANDSEITQGKQNEVGIGHDQDKQVSYDKPPTSFDDDYNDVKKGEDDDELGPYNTGYDEYPGIDKYGMENYGIYGYEDYPGMEDEYEMSPNDENYEDASLSGEILSGMSFEGIALANLHRPFAVNLDAPYEEYYATSTGTGMGSESMLYTHRTQ